MASCAVPLGAVSPAEAPSWLTALPRITARTWSPSRRASARRLRTSTPQPSERTKPLASAEKVRQRPSGESMWAWLTATHEAGSSSRLTPPASTVSLSPERSERSARWMATSEEEQAVSTATAGPRSPRAKEIRPAAAFSAVPVP